MMKHCAKKLLGLAFALALCLAVGGTALAQTPEFADVPDALPEQEMLAYEPYAAPAAGNNVTGDLATDGYTVTIPTTVEVHSGDNKGTLPVTAQLKQYRTLNIGIASKNDWKLQYDGAAGADAPKVGYELKYANVGAHTPRGMWHYDEGGHKITYATSAVESFDTAEIPLSVNIPTPSQATMSGNYSDTLTFTFNITKQSVTYTINVYHQEMQLTGNYFSGADVAPNYQALKMVDKVGTDGEPIGSATPDEVYTYEYGFANDLPVGNPSDTWTRPRTGHGVTDDEDTRCWEDLTYDLNLQKNYDDDNKNIVVNLNLVRKWCWLDVNGITDKATCADYLKDGNQGGRIASFVNIRVSDGTNWSGWYWYRYGDDYWGTFPYGTEFQLGLHRVKDGYVYDEDAAGNVEIYANGSLTCTTGKESSNGTNYRVYNGKMEGEPVDTTLHNTTGGGNVHDGAGNKDLPRYCYNPCFVDGITYYANGGTGGMEDTNLYHGAHTSFKYTDGMKLADPTDCAFTAPEGKVFAGWSTTPNYTGQTLYDANTNVSDVAWLAKTDTSNHDTLPQNDGQTVCRTLYAIWGYDITVQFEDNTGYTADGTKDPVFGSPMIGYSFTLTGQAVEEGKGWTLDLDNPVVKEKITEATNEAKSAAGDNDTKTGRDLERKIWKIDSYTEDGHHFDYTEECTISAADLKSGTRTLMIQRRRYLLSVISADADTGEIYGIATDPLTPKYGTFTVTVNNGVKSATEKSNTSFYQCGLNYGAEYEIKNVNAKKGYTNQFYTIFKLSLKVEKVDLIDDYTPETAIAKYMGEPYSGFMTAKKSNIHYYTDGGNSSTDIYTGDPVRVAFSKDSTPGSTTPMPGPSLAPGLSSPAPSAGLALHYHANFVPEDALAETVKTVYCSAVDVTVHPCMFKRAGYAFVGWNTEEDGTGTWYWVNGVPLTNWRAGETVDLYAQWRKTAAQKPVWDDPDPVDPADPDATPEWIDDSFDADFGADPDPQPEKLGDAFSVDPDPLPDELDDAFGVDPDPQPEKLDDAFGIDPDPLPEGLDDAFGIDPGGDADALLMC